jgi:hypothetical protein
MGKEVSFLINPIEIMIVIHEDIYYSRRRPEGKGNDGEERERDRRLANLLLLKGCRLLDVITGRVKIYQLTSYTHTILAWNPDEEKRHICIIRDKCVRR